VRLEHSQALGGALLSKIWRQRDFRTAARNVAGANGETALMIDSRHFGSKKTAESDCTSYGRIRLFEVF
jgi:hypothetical protein